MPFSIRPFRRFPVPLRFTSTLALSLVCLAAPALADYEAGLDAYERGDYATALREFRPLAERGHAHSQYSLGVLYDEGQGVPQDYVQARQWYEKAAVQGYANAQTNLGILYDKGQGGPADYAQALHWYGKAAGQGDAKAQVFLGAAYADGDSVPQDFVQAHKWYNLGGANGEKLESSFVIVSPER